MENARLAPSFSLWLISGLLLFASSENILPTVYQNAPPKVIPIKRVGYIPNEKQVDQGCLLKRVRPICMDPQGFVYVADWNYCSVYKFSRSGDYLGSFGKKGQGPEEFGIVNDIAAFDGGIAILDHYNMRCVFVDPGGRHLSSFKLAKSYSGFAVSKDAKRIYAAPSSGDTLIEVLDSSGNPVGGFGEKLNFNNKRSSLNSVFLGVSPEGEVWVAWQFFPIIRGYRADGDLIVEIRIADAALDNAIKGNEKAADSKTVSNRVTVMGINNGFYVGKDGCYTFLYGEDRQPRIVKFNRWGDQTAVYEFVDKVDKEIYVDFIVGEREDEATFFILQGFPEARVDIFRTAGLGH